MSFFLFSFKYFTLGLLAFELAQLIQIIPDKVRSVEWTQAETLSGYNYLTDCTEQRKARI